MFQKTDKLTESMLMLIQKTLLCALEVYLKIRYGQWAASMGLRKV